jgi:hypothetical protein
MTLDQIVKIQSVIDKRAISSDTLEFLNEERYSNSKQCMIRYGDMHIDHFLRVCAIEMSGYIDNETTFSFTGKEMLQFVSKKVKEEFGNGNN